MRRRLVTIAIVVSVLLAGIVWFRDGGETVLPDRNRAAQERDSVAPAQVELRGAGVVSRASPLVTDSSPVATATHAPAAGVVEVRGIVLDPAGDPSPGTVVVARFAGRWKGFWNSKTSTSDAHGNFAFELPEGVSSVDLTCGSLEGNEGAARTSLGSEMAGVVVPRHDLILRLVDASYIRGVVVDEVGEPVPSVRLAAWAFAGAIHAPTSVATTTDGSGRFVLGPLRAGTWTLVTTPQADWTYAEMSAVAPADGVTFRVSRGLTLRGHLVGPDAEGFEVVWILPRGPEGIRQGAVRTDASGDFAIAGLPDVPVRLFARRIGDARYGLVEDARPFTRTREIPLVTGETIEGRCDGYDGRVIAHNGDLQHEGRAEGETFRIVGLPPGRWTLRRVIRIEASDGSFAIESEGLTETGAESGAANVALR